MSTESFLRLVVEILDALGIPFMLTGSLASSYHGIPRATQDIDIVVDPTPDQLTALGQRLSEAGLYVSSDAMQEARKHRGLFNAVDGATGSKIDFILLKDRAFSREEFERRESAELGELALSVVRCEDIVVAKLEWAQLGESERQLRDVLGILQIQGEGLDRARVERWVAELGLDQQWERALELERATREST